MRRFGGDKGRSKDINRVSIDTADKQEIFSWANRTINRMDTVPRSGTEAFTASGQKDGSDELMLARFRTLESPASITICQTKNRARKVLKQNR